MTTQSTEQAIAEIWKLFRETDAKFKETDAQFKETDAKFKETDAQFKETDKRLDQRIAETDARLAEDLMATRAELRKLEGLFGNQWGRLIEALVRPGVLSLFQQRGHDVRRLHQRSTATVDGRNMEIDIILEDGAEVIPVEVKTTLTIEAVNDFLDALAEFTVFFPIYQPFRVYGAVAGLEVPQNVGRYAYKRGLYVVSVTGTDMVEILNDEKFMPHDFGNTALNREGRNRSI